MATTTIKNVGDLDPVLKRMDKFGVAVTQDFMQAMTNSVNDLEYEIVKRTPVGVGYSPTGFLASSIFGEVQSTERGLLGIVASPAVYGVAVEEGTKPHFPPEEALWDWVRLKLGISNKQEMIGVAWLIKMKIGAHGTKGKHMFRDGYTASEPKIRRWFLKAFHAAAKKIG